ncbi:MAG TPA: gliding motility-associated C-terminal domain-containing protein [Luteibaculaceae bacterium]|nr:gliding motility-associated C-terminal domain-containing protein [Luteibaculaceae bacterium]
MRKLRNLLILTALTVLTQQLKAQDVFANSETNSSTPVTCVTCAVTNSANSIDGDLTNFATLALRTALVGGSVEQTLFFPSPGAAGDTVVFTLEVGYAPAAGRAHTLEFNSFLGGVSNAEAVSTPFASVAPTGGGIFQFVFMPSAAYDAVQITFQSGTIVNAITGGDSLNIYSARILRSLLTPSTPAAISGCEYPDTATTAISASCLAGCAVDNPQNITTQDPTDFATLRINPLLLNTSVTLNGIYADTACYSDTVFVSMENAAGAFDTASYPLITVNALLGGTVVFGGTLDTYNPADITFVGNQLFLRVTPGVPFDGIQVINSGTVGNVNNINALRVYNMCLQRLAPPVPVDGRVAQVCFNDGYTIRTLAPTNCIAQFYDAPTGGTLLGSGSQYFTGPLTDTTVIYFESLDTVQGCVSRLRDSVVVNVLPLTPPPFIPQDTVFICFNRPAILTPMPYGRIYNYYSDAAGTNLIGSGVNFITDTLLNDTVFYIQNTNLGICPGPDIVPMFVKLIPDAYTADIADTIVYCLNSVNDLVINEPVPGITYRWYAPDGTLLFSGNPYPNYLSDKDSTLFIETLFGVCTESPNRKPLTLLTVDQATLDAFVQSPIYVCNNDTAVVTATTGSTFPGTVFEWTDFKDSLVFVGNPISVRSPIDSMVFYVNTRVDQCISADSAELKLINLLTVSDEDFDTLVTICDGAQAVLTSNIKIPGAVYSWYDDPFSTTPVFVGDTFITPALNNPEVYFFEISNVNCLNEVERRRIDVRIFAAPPTISVDTNLVYYCNGDFAVLSAKATPDPAVVTWWDAPSNGNRLFTGDTFRFQPTADTLLIFAESRVDQCASTSRVPVLVVNATTLMGVSANGATICEGSSTQLSASSQIVGGSFSWWSAPTGGTKLATANPFNTPILNNTTIYYVGVEFFNPNICADPPRTPVTVEVRRILTAPQVTCGPASNTSLSFSWTGDPNTVNYEISTDGGNTFFAPNNALGPNTHEITGLEPDSTITAIVRSIGSIPCQNSPYSAAVTCKATDCTPVNSNLDKAFYEICDDQTATITVRNLPPNYRVIFNGLAATTDTVFTYSNNNPGTYELPIRVYVDGEQSCDTLDLVATVIVRDSPNAQIDAVALAPTVAGGFINTFQFLSNTGGGMTWSWNFGDGGTSSLQNPVYAYADTGRYTVTLFVVNQYGCDDTDTLDRDIIVTRIPEIFIPNTFTPNTDGKNDLFKVYGQNITLVNMKIFNTYGNLVFESNELARGWDGRYNGEPAPSGTYYYTATIKDEVNVKYEREGTITLIRK